MHNTTTNDVDLHAESNKIILMCILTKGVPPSAARYALGITQDLGTLLGVGQTGKQCTIGTMAIKRQGRAFAHAQLVAGQRVNSPWSSSQGHFSTVINLDRGRSSGTRRLWE